MIRRITSADILPIIELGRKLHAEIGDLPEIDENGCKMLLARALCHKRHIVLVHERQGEITGVLFGLIEELFFSKELHATDVFFHSTGGAGVYLLRHFVKWANSMGVERIDCGVSSGMNPEQATKLFSLAGFAPIGGIFQYRGNK